MANEEFKVFKSLNGGKPVEGTLWFHYARLIEDLYCMERTVEILEDPDVLSNDIVAESKGLVGEGVGCIEAPRGTLIHHYLVDEKGMITKCNLIVSTTHNNEAMNQAGQEVKDEIDAASSEDALAKIRNLGYFPTRIREKGGTRQKSASPGKKPKTGSSSWRFFPPGN